MTLNSIELFPPSPPPRPVSCLCGYQLFTKCIPLCNQPLQNCGLTQQRFISPVCGLTSGPAGLTWFQVASLAEEPRLPDMAALVAPEGSQKRRALWSPGSITSSAPFPGHSSVKANPKTNMIIWGGDSSWEEITDPIPNGGSFKIFGPDFQTRPS